MNPNDLDPVLHGARRARLAHMTDVVLGYLRHGPD